MNEEVVMTGVDAGVEEEFVDDYNHEYEFIMLNLRTKYGINLKKYKEIFKKDFLLFYKDEIEAMDKFIELKHNAIVVKDNNYMILNRIILRFINKLEVYYNGYSSLKE